MSKRVVLSGCSGGGKSTLISELAKLGHDVVLEPGHRIVSAEIASGGTALPWVDGEAFARRAIEVSRQDMVTHSVHDSWVFYDRGLVDASSALASITGVDLESLLQGELDYHHKVFLVPPWQDLFQNDEQRKHSFASAVEEYNRLVRDFATLGYEVVVIPQLSVAERVKFLLAQLS